MKGRFLYITVALVLIQTAVFPQSNDQRWDTANKAYMEGDYATAIDGYEAILGSGYSSSELFYNLGNSYYKTDNTGKAILNYNRALRLDPNNKDIKHNLTLADARTTTKINAVPKFFLVRWVDSLRNLMSSDGWAKLSTLLIAMTFVSIAIFIFSISPPVRKTFFTIAIITFLGYFMATHFATKQKNILLHSGEAIVMYNSTAVKSSPDSSSDDLFILDEGTKVLVLEKIGSWSEVEIASGNRGWLETSSIELIDLPVAAAN